MSANLLTSLLDAIVRLDADALVMHVGDKPYVVTTSAAPAEYRGPLTWGQVELSSRVLTSEAVLGMLAQLLPGEQRQALDEFGAVEYAVNAEDASPDRFTVVAARSGDDVWLEVRRKSLIPARPVVAAKSEAAMAQESSQPDATAARTAAVPASGVPVPPSAAEPVLVIEQEGDEEDEDSEAAEAGKADEEEVVFELSLDTLSDPAPRPDTSAAPVLEVVHDESQIAPTHAEVDALLASAAALLTASKTVDAAPAARAEPLAPPEPAVMSTPPAPPAAVTPPEPAPAVEPARSVAAARPVEPVHSPLPSPPIAATPPVEPVVVPVAEAPEEIPLILQTVDAPGAVAKDLPWCPPAGGREIAVPAAPEPAAVPGPAAQRPRAPVEEAPVAASAGMPAIESRAPERPAEEPRQAVVLPMSRSPIRPEPPPEATTVVGAPLERVLRIAAARGAATVYVVAQSRPVIRVDGEISVLDGESVMTAAEVERLVMDLTPAQGKDHSRGGGEWVADVPDVGRVRCVTFRDHRGPGVIFRMIPPQAISVEQLGLTPAVQALCGQPDGLVLVTGARASGKSTLLSAFVDLINRTRSDHVITIESQIGFVHESRKSFVSQREVRGDGEAAAAAVRSAFREDPDVIVIEDLRTLEIVSIALEAADSGRLVLASLSAPSTVAAIERLIEMFPAGRRAQAQTTLAGALRGVVSQVLLRKVRGGRIAAREVLINTPAVASLILEGKLFQLPVALDSGRRHGMTPLADALAALVREGTVHASEAYRKALDRDALLAVLKREGVDTSFAERLA